MRRPGCRPTRQDYHSQAPWQQGTLSATTWRGDPSLLTPIPPWSQPGRLLLPRLRPSRAWPLHLTMALLHPWPPRSALALFWEQLPCFATLPSLDPLLAGTAIHTYLPWTLMYILKAYSHFSVIYRTYIPVFQSELL